MSLTATAGTRLGAVVRRRRSRAPWLDYFVYAIMTVILIACVFGPMLAPHDPYRTDLDARFLSPRAGYWLGTDASGRDILSRLLVGARGTLLSATAIALLASFVGVAIAAIAAVSGKWADDILMRVCDIALSLPLLVFGLGISVALGPSLRSAIIALVLAMWPGFARLARGVIRQTMTESYVEAARTMGASKFRLMVKHVLPNSLDVVVVHTAFDIGGVTLLLAGMSFIGVGAQPPSAEWGAMASDGRGYIVTAWWASLAPGIAITLCVVAMGLFGDILQARMDPALRGGRK